MGIVGAVPRPGRRRPRLKAGDAVSVTLELEEGPGPVEVPPALAAALQDADLTDVFARLGYSKRKEVARQVAEAKAEETRDRRIAKVVDSLR